MLCILIPADEIRVGLKEEVYIFEPDLREVCTVLSHFCRVQLFVTLWTIAHQAPLSMGFSWQEYWSGLLCSPPGSLLDPGIEPMSLMWPALASGFFTISILLGKYAQFPVVYVNNMYFMHIYQFCMTDCSLIWRLVRTKRNSTREFGDETQRGKHEVTSWRKKKELHAI